MYSRFKDKTITHGETLSDNGVEINGFVNNENETALSGLEHAFDYAQFSDIELTRLFRWMHELKITKLHTKTAC